MKKYLLTLIMTLVGLSAFAQVEPGFRMGIRATGGLAGLTECNASWKASYGLGWIAEYNITRSFYVDSGVNFRMLGMKDGYVDDKSVSGTINALYAEVPVHIGYRLHLGSTALFIQVGPTLQYGILASDIEWNSSRKDNYFDIARRFDVGVGGRLGVEFSRFQVSFGSDFGVLSVFEDGGHNLDYNLGLAYMF